MHSGLCWNALQISRATALTLESNIRDEEHNNRLEYAPMGQGPRTIMWCRPLNHGVECLFIGNIDRPLGVDSGMSRSHGFGADSGETNYRGNLFKPIPLLTQHIFTLLDSSRMPPMPPRLK